MRSHLRSLAMHILHSMQVTVTKAVGSSVGTSRHRYILFGNCVYICSTAIHACIETAWCYSLNYRYIIFFPFMHGTCMDHTNKGLTPGLYRSLKDNYIKELLAIWRHWSLYSFHWPLKALKPILRCRTSGNSNTIKPYSLFISWQWYNCIWRFSMKMYFKCISSMQISVLHRLVTSLN